MRLVKTPWNENVKNEIEGMRTRIRRKTEGAVFTMRHAVDEKRKNDRKKMKDPNLKQRHWWYRLGLLEQCTVPNEILNTF